MRINPLDFQENIKIGVKFPFTSDGTSFVASEYNSFNQIKSNLLNLLSTEKGERIMNVEYGVELRKHLFQQNDNIISSKIMDSIEEAVQRWMPYVNIETTDIVQDNNIIYINIKFSTQYNPIQTDNIQISI